MVLMILYEIRDTARLIGSGRHERYQHLGRTVLTDRQSSVVWLVAGTTAETR